MGFFLRAKKQKEAPLNALVKILPLNNSWIICEEMQVFLIFQRIFQKAAIKSFVHTV